MAESSNHELCPMCGNPLYGCMECGCAGGIDYCRVPSKAIVVEQAESAPVIQRSSISPVVDSWYQHDLDRLVAQHSEQQD